nr:helix-turn-helix domain-containing protein [Enterocloster clostridioformis]
MTESAKLLVFSCKPIVQIAFLSGYQSQQAFTNAFTAMYRMPPNMYRENERFSPSE